MLNYKNLLPTGVAGKKYAEYEEELRKKDVKETKESKKLKKKALHQMNRLKKYDKFLPDTLYKPAKIDNAVQKDSLTRDMIQESVAMFPKKGAGVLAKENPLRPQSSAPPAHFDVKQELSNTLGMSGLNFSPLKLRRVYGRTDTIGVLNLTGIHKSHIVYASANVIIIFDYFLNSQSMLQGHKNKITCLAKDPRCKYFASGDVGKDSSIIIWDINTGYPHKVFPASHTDLGVIEIGFVFFGEHIGTIGCEQRREESEDGTVTYENLQTVCIWNFSRQDDPHHRERAGGKPEAYLVIPKQAGYQKDLVFNEEYPDYFVSTGHTHVVFYTWLKDEKKISAHLPKIPKRFMKRMKQFTQSIWMKSNNWCLTGTTTGYVVAWATPIPLGLQEPPNPNLNIKEYKRSFKIGDEAITTLTSYKDFFVIGDAEGHVKFFDNRFRIVRWTQTTKIRPINSIEFNYGESKPDFKEEMQINYNRDLKPHAHREGISAVRDYTFGGEKYRQPSQTTIERPPFIAPDFVMGCEGGSVYYYHLAEGKVDTLIYGTPGQIVAIDTCPNTPHITMSTTDGDIQMYDYMTHTLIFSGRIFKKAVEVTALKFHPSGAFAFFGMKNGLLYFRRAYTWKAMETPLENCNSAIERIVFSEDGINMAHYDSSNTVTAYVFQTRHLHWIMRGRHRSHSKPVVDLVFHFDSTTRNNRLFSLGQDRLVIEYNLADSSIASGLVIQSIFYAEQTSIPTSMVFDEPWPGLGPHLMYANSDNKIKIMDINDFRVRRCCQGPSYGTPINRMIMITPDNSSGHSTKFILLLLGNKIGLMKTPVDGNPFKSMAILGHPDGIRDAVMGCNHLEIFTCGNEDNSVFMWEPNIQVLETCALSGGYGVTPYMRMLDAGLPEGKSLVQDIENIFYHLMLRLVTSAEEMFKMDLEIPIPEIPTVLRTCGFFPTEFEIQVMMEEAEFLGLIKAGEIPTVISYEDFIRLFANHRPIPALAAEDIFKAFEVLGQLDENDELFMDRATLRHNLTTRGETLTDQDLFRFLPNFYQLKEIYALLDGANAPAWLQLTGIDRSVIKGRGKNKEENGTEETVKGEVDEHPRTGSSSESLVVAEEPALLTDFAADQDQEITSELTGKSKEKMAADNVDTDVASPQESQFNIELENTSKESLLGEVEGEEEVRPAPDADEAERMQEMELLEDIYAKFFVQELLPEDALNPMDWNNLTKHGEQLILDEICSQNPLEVWDEILLRWKGRDEWRYFNRIFDRFTDTSFPLNKKLKMAIEMDYYCRTGLWPNVAPSNFRAFSMAVDSGEEEAEGGDQNEGEGEEEPEVKEAEKKSSLKPAVTSEVEAGVPEKSIEKIKGPPGKDVEPKSEVILESKKTEENLKATEPEPESLDHHKHEHRKTSLSTHPEFDEEEEGETSEGEDDSGSDFSEHDEVEPDSTVDKPEPPPGELDFLSVPKKLSESEIEMDEEEEEEEKEEGTEEEDTASPPFSNLPETANLVGSAESLAQRSELFTDGTEEEESPPDD